MDNKILEILLDMQKEIKDMKSEMKDMKSEMKDMKSEKRVAEFNTVN